MAHLFESLENRVLFSDIASVTADYDAIVSDASFLKSTVASVATTYKADAKAIAAQIKTLPKSKINSLDVSKVNKAVSAANSLNVRDAAKLISVGKVALLRAKAAFVADISKPTASRAAKVSVALGILSNALAPYEAKLATAVATGDANIATALATLASANPTDTALGTAIASAGSDETAAVGNITSIVIQIDSDILNLIADIS